MEIVHVRHEQNHMATTFDLRVSCESRHATPAGDILDEALLMVGALERELSEFHPESPVRELNEAQPMTQIKISDSLLELLEQSRRIRIETNGCFNPEAKGSPEVRSLQSFEWDPQSRLAWKLHSGAHLSFGAIGKGYAIDRVRALLERNGLRNYILSAGGSSLAVSGFAAPRHPWSWAWSWKKDSQGNDLGIRLQHQTGNPLSIGVSGSHEKGQHVLDARTLLPDSGAPSCLSTLVGLPSATEADAYSTAFFVAGWDETLSFFKKRAAAPALGCVEKNHGMRWNGIFRNFWGTLERPSQAVASRTLLLLLSLGTWIGVGASARADEAVDLSALGLEGFNPYSFDRNSWWAALPLFGIALVALHLKKIGKLKTRRVQDDPRKPLAKTP